MSSILAKYHQIQEPLGEGAYGVVFKAINSETNEVVALKKIRLDLEEEGIPSTALREISILKSLEHPNIVRLIEVEHGNGRLYLVFECCDGDLKKWMENELNTKTSIPIEKAKSFAYQLLLGLDYCHSCGVMHRDLKPQNLLLNSDGVLKLADFGLARSFNLPVRELTHEVITLWYRAPEILLGSKQYSTSIDIWSAGVIIAELIQGEPLYQGDSEIDMLFKIFHSKGLPTETDWPGVSQLPDFKDQFPSWPTRTLDKTITKAEPLALDLLNKMLCYDPSKRITARDALQHPWFNDLDKSKYASPI
ncbi:hypothetical protein WA158_002242 [Blastocystis sp. Blastoise]